MRDHEDVVAVDDFSDIDEGSDDDDDDEEDDDGEDDEEEDELEDGMSSDDFSDESGDDEYGADMMMNTSELIYITEEFLRYRDFDDDDEKGTLDVVRFNFELGFFLPQSYIEVKTSVIEHNPDRFKKDSFELLSPPPSDFSVDLSFVPDFDVDPSSTPLSPPRPPRPSALKTDDAQSSSKEDDDDKKVSADENSNSNNSNKNKKKKGEYTSRVRIWYNSMAGKLNQFLPGKLEGRELENLDNRMNDSLMQEEISLDEGDDDDEDLDSADIDSDDVPEDDGEYDDDMDGSHSFHYPHEDDQLFFDLDEGEGISIGSDHSPLDDDDDDDGDVGSDDADFIDDHDEGGEEDEDEESGFRIRHRRQMVPSASPSNFFDAFRQAFLERIAGIHVPRPSRPENESSSDDDSDKDGTD